MTALNTTVKTRLNTHSGYDLIVIGSGPGGEGAAMNAAKEGLRVLVIDKQIAVGGNCTHWGTIPSKALRWTVQRLVDLTQNPLLADIGRQARFEFPQLLKSATAIISKQVSQRRTVYERNLVTVIHGHAQFVDPHTIEVVQEKGARERFQAKAFMIATGSRPYRPPGIDFSHPCIFDSDTILSLKHTPQSVTVYGAGVIGCEYASIFRLLGCKLNLINTRAKLLEFLDDEIIDALAYHLREQGALIRHNEEVERVEPLSDGVVLHLKSGKRLKSDVLLWANGRSGNSDNLGLETVGIIPDRRGNLTVNANHQTSVPHIYAAGDIVGFPALASASYDQGRFAVSHLIHGKSDHLAAVIPTGIYTTPEISCVGATERELTEKKVPYEIGHAFFRSLARAQITGQTVGMLKLLFHRETLELLGIHCFGDQAAEIVHIGQAIMAQPGKANSVEYFANTTFNYPTMAEAYRVAALNGLNRLYELRGARPA